MLTDTPTCGRWNHVIQSGTPLLQIAWILRWPNNCRMRSSTTDLIPFQKIPKLCIALTRTASFAFVSTWDTPPPPPVPAQPAHFCQYVAFLARPLKTTSIPNYRVVTKISNCRVNTTSRRGIKWLGISFGSIFLLFFNKSSRGPLS